MRNSHVIHFVTKAVGASFYKCLCFPLSLSSTPHCSLSIPLTTCLDKAILSFVYTEDIKWPSFTEMLELLLYAEVLLSQRLCMEIRRYQQGGGKK